MENDNHDNQKPAKKPDRRIAKTKKAICSAFVKLLSKKDFNQISVKDVAVVADVNRKTIYNYYKGIYQILDEIENHIVSTYIDVINGINFRDVLKDPSIIFHKLTEVLSSNLDFYGSLLKCNADSQLVVKIMTSLKEVIKKSFLEQELVDDANVDLAVTYTVSVLVTSYQYWFNSNRTETIEDFSKRVSSLLLTGLVGYIRKEK